MVSGLQALDLADIVEDVESEGIKMSLTIASKSWHAQIQRGIRCEQFEKASMRLLLRSDVNGNTIRLMEASYDATLPDVRKAWTNSLHDLLADLSVTMLEEVILNCLQGSSSAHASEPANARCCRVSAT